MQSDDYRPPIKVNCLPTSPAEQKKNTAKEKFQKNTGFHFLLGGNPDIIH